MKFFKLKAWPAFAGLALCLGFVMDVMNARTELEKHMSTILPIFPAVFPLISAVGALYFGGIILKWIWDKSLDRYRGGPKKRQFQAMRLAIQSCRTHLEALDQPMHLGMQLFSPDSPAQVSENLTRLHLDLRQLGIEMPDADLGSPEHRRRLAAYLARLEINAQHGDLERARQLRI